MFFFPSLEETSKDVATCVKMGDQQQLSLPMWLSAYTQSVTETRGVGDNAEFRKFLTLALQYSAHTMRM